MYSASNTKYVRHLISICSQETTGDLEMMVDLALLVQLVLWVRLADQVMMDALELQVTMILE